MGTWPIATITDDQIALVEESFDSFYPAAYDAVASTFYDELFQRDPLVRALFPHDLHDQRPQQRLQSLRPSQRDEPAAGQRHPRPGHTRPVRKDRKRVDLQHK